jgi:hypothetical protein
MKSILLTLAALSCLCAADDLRPLPIELPKPMFEGTPQNLQVPNLEKPRGLPREKKRHLRGPCMALPQAASGI